MNVCDAVALKIKKLLKIHNITLYKLEQESCIPHGTMMRIVHGKNKNITLKIVMQIASGFHMSVIDFLNDELFLNGEIDIY